MVKACDKGFNARSEIQQTIQYPQRFLPAIQVEHTVFETRVNSHGAILLQQDAFLIIALNILI